MDISDDDNTEDDLADDFDNIFLNARIFGMCGVVVVTSSFGSVRAALYFIIYSGDVHTCSNVPICSCLQHTAITECMGDGIDIVIYAFAQETRVSCDTNTNSNIIVD